MTFVLPCDESHHQTRSETIVTWIERTYHRRRRQDALGRLTPVEHETINTLQVALAS